MIILKKVKPILNLDKDGVVTELLNPTLRIYKEHFDSTCELKRENIVHYDLRQLPLVKNTRDELYIPHGKKIFLDYATLIDENSPNVIDDLMQEIEIHIVTDQFNEDNKRYAIECMEKFKINYNKIFFTGKKGEQKGHIAVEDSPYNLVDCHNCGKYTIGFDAPYNKDWKGIRVSSYEEMKKEIIKILKQL
ncbi:MAG: hypothetical protein AB7V77_00460 [Candidatus Woesearchaeota archaeon]